MPKIEIIDFMLNRFNDTNIGMTITGDNAKQFIDKEIYNNFVADKINDDGTIEHLEGKEVVVGIDMSKSTDLTGVSIVAKDDEMGRKLQDMNLMTRKRASGRRK